MAEHHRRAAHCPGGHIRGLGAMPTLPPLNLQSTTDAPQVFYCRGATDMQITISTAGVYLAFARDEGGILGGFGPEEFHGLELLTITAEQIGAVQYRSAVAGQPAVITIIPST